MSQSEAGPSQRRKRFGLAGRVLEGNRLLIGCLLLAAGCSLYGSPATLPRRNAVVSDQLVIHSDFSLPQHHRRLEDLRRLRGTVQETLALPTSDEPIHVYLFEHESEYYGFLRKNYPSFPARRACFVQSDTALAVYAHWGDRIAEDLRHEVSHGYLHSVVPNIPLWLDEGLAEYFETPRDAHGLNQPHVALLNAELAAGKWHPNLERVATLTDAADMTQIDYAEAWAWAYFLLDGRPDARPAVREYLAALRASRPTEPLSTLVHRQMPDAETQLAAFLRGLPATPAAQQSLAAE